MPKRTKPTKLVDNKPISLTPTQTKILEVKSDNPNLTTREIGKLANCSHVTVIDTLRKYGLDKQEIDSYKQTRADIFAGKQGRILSLALTDEHIKTYATKFPHVLPVWFNSLFNNERLERGESTQNVSVLAHIASEYQKSLNGNDND